MPLICSLIIVNLFQELQNRYCTTNNSSSVLEIFFNISERNERIEESIFVNEDKEITWYRSLYVVIFKKSSLCHFARNDLRKLQFWRLVCVTSHLFLFYRFFLRYVNQLCLCDEEMFEDNIPDQIRMLRKRWISTGGFEEHHSWTSCSSTKIWRSCGFLCRRELYHAKVFRRSSWKTQEHL